MSQNLSETQFHYVIKLILRVVELKQTHLLRESGAVVLLVQWLETDVVFTNICC